MGYKEPNKRGFCPNAAPESFSRRLVYIVKAALITAALLALLEKIFKKDTTLPFDRITAFFRQNVANPGIRPSLFEEFEFNPQDRFNLENLKYTFAIVLLLALGLAVLFV